ncbi:Zinc finger protein MSN2 [Folsomia candida]|uniref:Zinc finger protein MSN2 n=1 Tax=Folsomia candida TaxID=158441 RepID=A0A226DW38_FOLCA|nr:Zinc finger protein MSN2 [Folsomia candida]
MATELATELAAEVNTLKAHLCQSRYQIDQIARRAGVVIDQDEFCSNPCDILAKLLHLVDEILSLPVTESVIFTTLALQGSLFPITFNDDGSNSLLDVLNELCSSLPETLEDDTDFLSDQIFDLEQDVAINESQEKLDLHHTNVTNLDLENESSLETSSLMSSKNQPNLEQGKKLTSFNAQQFLNVRMITHDPNAKVKCEATHLQKSSRKIFQCPRCPKKFLSGYGLRRHAARHDVPHAHDKVKKFVCPLCDMRFSRSNNLKRHLTVIHHVDQASCDLGTGQKSSQSCESTPVLLPPEVVYHV